MLTGMNAAVRVQLKENDGRLLIPLAAVQEDANGIYVCTGYDKSSDEATDPIEITTGLSDLGMAKTRRRSQVSFFLWKRNST